jgi:hypothetical protein
VSTESATYQLATEAWSCYSCLYRELAQPQLAPCLLYSTVLIRNKPFKVPPAFTWDRAPSRSLKYVWGNMISVSQGGRLLLMRLQCQLRNVSPNTAALKHFFPHAVRLTMSPLGTAATVWRIVPAQDDSDECGAVGGMRIGRGNRSTRRKPAPVPLCPPQIPHVLNRARTWAAAMGSWRLTAWAMKRAVIKRTLDMTVLYSTEGHRQKQLYISCQSRSRLIFSLAGCDFQLACNCN